MEALPWDYKKCICEALFCVCIVTSLIVIVSLRGIDFEGALQNAFDLHRAWPEAVLRVGEGLP